MWSKRRYALCSSSFRLHCPAEEVLILDRDKEREEEEKEWEEVLESMAVPRRERRELLLSTPSRAFSTDTALALHGRNIA